MGKQIRSKPLFSSQSPTFLSLPEGKPPKLSLPEGNLQSSQVQ